MPLEGRVALITGAASGIGRAAALRMARLGAATALVDLDEPEGTRVAAAIAAEGGRARFFRADVSREEEVKSAVEAAVEAFGALHVLVNAAGILQGAYQPVARLEAGTFARVLEVNLLGTFLACKHAAPRIQQAGGGVILCIASHAGVKGGSSSLAYGASKGGVQGFCYTLERELAPRGIRVNVVCPGSIDTPMKRRNLREAAEAAGRDLEEALAAAALGDPDGVARVLAFLASSEADYVVGTLFTR